MVPRHETGNVRNSVSMQRVRHATGPHAQPEPVPQEGRDLAVREAEVFVEQHDQRDRVPPQMRTRRAERISSLQRMPALHSPATAVAAPYMHIEPTDMRSHHGQIFLILGRDACRSGRPAVRAPLGQGDVDAVIDRRRRLPMGMAPMPSTRATAGRTGVRGGRALRERRRLTLAGAARGVKRPCQPLNLAPQTIALAFEPRVLVAQSTTFIARLLGLAAQPLQLPLSVIDRLRCVASRHATVMAQSAILLAQLEAGTLFWPQVRGAESSRVGSPLNL
jgi:hypothetical protein